VDEATKRMTQVLTFLYYDDVEAGASFKNGKEKMRKKKALRRESAERKQEKGRWKMEDGIENIMG